jgi:hypothetical protein
MKIAAAESLIGVINAASSAVKFSFYQGERVRRGTARNAVACY